MSDQHAAFDACSPRQQLILGLLALIGEPLGRTRLAAHLRPLGERASDEDIAADLAQLIHAGLAAELGSRGTVIAPAAAWPAIDAVLRARRLGDVRELYAHTTPLRVDWQGQPVLRSYRQGLALLRMALLAGDGPRGVTPLLDACLRCHEAQYLHPLVELCARPFEPALIERINPALRDMVLAVLLDHAQWEPALAPPIRAYAEDQVAHGDTAFPLRAALAEHLLLCGRIDDAQALARELDESFALFIDAAATVLRDDAATALPMFELALKALRRETGRRNAVFAGFGGYLYATAVIRANDPPQRKRLDAYLASATRAQNHDSAVYQQLSTLHHIRAGTADADTFASRNWEGALLPFTFRALIHYWLGLDQLAAQRDALEQQLALASDAGFDTLAAQLAQLLGSLARPGCEQQAAALRQRHRISDLTLWFEREQPWERQLNALINLQPAVNQEAVRGSRLVWLVGYHPQFGVTELEPREQKRDAQGGWTRGRAMGLKRLADEAADLDFLTAQDVQAASAVGAHRYYGSGARYELNLEQAVAALVGHPLLFWADAPGTRLELLPGEPQLLVKAAHGKVTITLDPPLHAQRGEVVVTRETPTRLRVVRIKEEHRRIGAIVGAGLTVPLDAEKQVLRAIGAVSSVVTVQSDIGASAADIEQVTADARLHVHLLPYQQGLRIQVLVRPLPEAGPFFRPGAGTESVIADVGGIRTEARRDLLAEREAERTLLAHCLALEQAEHEHGEWLLGQPLPCLELVTQLQELDAQQVVVAWPEGESFRVVKRAESSAVRISVQRDHDWFAASGEIVIDEHKVMDLRALLDRLREGDGRFVALGNNQFLALSAELHRRLGALAEVAEPHGDALRLHPLSAPTLEALIRDAGRSDTDAAWQAQLERMQAAERYQPRLPTTLQATLRDYQHEGFTWLARLAHWGAGACLADDMGLGKTLQTLALLLLRAPDGPALVVAPTSVCMNWLAEAARFAPTLNLRLFGPGDRAAAIDGAGPLDVVVTSYGLLQQEAARFAGRRWHSIVLDEAQAIKNQHTRRSQAVMALLADFRMVATGTPLENHLGELWNLFRFINPGLLGTSEQFQLRFAGPIEKAENRRAELGARQRLRRLTQPFILRRTKADVLTELPPRTEIVLPVELSEAETALYESLRRDALDKLAALEAPQSQKAIAILAEMTRLRRACCNPALVAPELGIASSKLTAFARLLDELLENRHKALVFSQFVDHLTLIRAHLDARGIPYQYLDGSTPMAERTRRIAAFQAGEGEVFLISLKAGGVGINLTAADYVIHMDPWWNPAVEDQASDRAHRMGQQRPVTIYRLVTRHTIEEGIVDLHRHKRDLADSLLAGTDAAARLSPSQMLAMLRQGLAA